MSDRKRLSSDVKFNDDDGTLAVPRYLADMTGQLESMARASKLELLAYLLAMARAEAENLALEARSGAPPAPH